MGRTAEELSDTMPVAEFIQRIALDNIRAAEQAQANPTT